MELQVTVSTDMTDIYTIIAQTAAEMLGVPIEHVTLKLGDSTSPVSSGSGGQWVPIRRRPVSTLPASVCAPNLPKQPDSTPTPGTSFLRMVKSGLQAAPFRSARLRFARRFGGGRDPIR